MVSGGAGFKKKAGGYCVRRKRPIDAVSLDEKTIADFQGAQGNRGKAG
eukprot:CAMPEP_0180679102 /NCGR_PEP_ID=MMETSP1037_2-20121125/68745_1 /TAXON_ID=632150 /ORGANISM="Azadinium spinosum, Strain 3D9" /LENGTH=47 /DNA_ID= /DNA_START= /DNA_END= /DNA_ORIENTATION=